MVDHLTGHQVQALKQQIHEILTVPEPSMHDHVGLAVYTQIVKRRKLVLAALEEIYGQPLGDLPESKDQEEPRARLSVDQYVLQAYPNDVQ